MSAAKPRYEVLWTETARTDVEEIARFIAHDSIENALAVLDRLEHAAEKLGPKVAIRLNNLASLLQDTNRLKEAEPLMRRALEIDEQSYGPKHPKIAIRLNNLAQLLKATNRVEDEPASPENLPRLHPPHRPPASAPRSGLGELRGYP